MKSKSSRNVVPKLYRKEQIAVKITVESLPQLGHADSLLIPRYTMEEFINLRDRLNESKSKLDVYWGAAKLSVDANKNWLQFQNIIDLYKRMRFEIEKKYYAKAVTNAWMKYWEIFSSFELVPANRLDKVPVVFFNAELPGAALCAFNHWWHYKFPGKKYAWRASSLAPDEATANNTTALGDSYGFFARNREKWLMNLAGENSQVASARRNNGDATKIDNLLDFAAQVGVNSSLGGADLYNHDAGIDVSSDFNNQERANLRLHLGCALAGFMTMRVGGSFIAKQYTFFETLSWNLILIYASLFEEFYVVKPLASRPYNSEIYLVGIKFKGLPDDLRKVLINKLENFNEDPLLPSSVSTTHREAISGLIVFARKVFGGQSEYINQNVELYEKYRHNLFVLRKSLDKLSRGLINDWMKKYPVGSIKDEDQLPSNLK